MKTESITFVNFKPAECGCKMEYTRGYGEYSETIEIILCRKHRKENYEIMEKLYEDIKAEEDGAND